MSTLVARGSERINPVLLKEVRAALRGRWFRSTFAIVLSLATIASLFYLMATAGSQDASRGPTYFGIMAACMAFGVHGLVPFAAMLSMTAEKDEHTLELLQLSNLAGWRIVLGKLGSAMLQYVLIASAFAPFLTMAFLMRGVPLSAIALTLLTSALFCMTQCSVGIMLGSLARARWARVILLMVFAMGLLVFSPMGLFSLFSFFLFGAMRMGLGGTGSLTTGGISLALVCLAVMCVSIAIASGRLAHGEENQSTPLRIATTFIILTGIGFAGFNDTPDGAVFALFATLICATPFLFIMVTERERLPRAVARHLPKWSRVFPLQAWLPGGGRGALFVIVHAALLLIAFEVWSKLNVVGQFEWEGYRFRSMLGAVMSLFLFLLLPSALLSRFTVTPGGRIASRALLALFLAGINLAPLFMSFILQRPELGDWAPLVAAFKESRAPYIDAPFRFLCTLAVLAVLANVPRLLASVREVSAARTRPSESAEGHAASVV